MLRVLRATVRAAVLNMVRMEVGSKKIVREWYYLAFGIRENPR